jgi:dGTPase
MEWGKLLKPYRLGCPKEECRHNPNRSEFQKDFDRIIFSPAFRRLNGKTQVFPFPETDIIHTRLTHSLEAASVGRSLGTIVGNEINNRDKEVLGFELGSVVCVACLAHDIGNPPLGHSGETAISEFFNSNKGQRIIKDLSSAEKADFERFEGNAMGFHILSYSNPNKTSVTGGHRLTYPTLAAFTKYPRPVLIENKKDGVSEKKPGLFQLDKECFAEIAHELEVNEKEEGGRWYRHPLAFLTEAADDICYGIMDLEDGYKHGMITYAIASELFKEICDAPSGKTDISNIRNIKDEREKVGYLRAKAINSLIHQMATVFLDNESVILQAKFDQQLCKIIESNEVMERIINISVSQIYSHRPVIQVEAAGFQVLPGLLDVFLTALKDIKKESSKKILQLIPAEYKFDYEKEPYEAIMSITAYIAGMTDTFAVNTYRTLQGIQLPNY